MTRASQIRYLLFLAFFLLRVVSRPAFLYASTAQDFQPQQRLLAISAMIGGHRVSPDSLLSTSRAVHRSTSDRDSGSRFFLLSSSISEPVTSMHELLHAIWPVLFAPVFPLIHPPA